MASDAGVGRSLWELCDRWLSRAEEVVRGSAEALNTLNVFPVPDADTGSNLTLTLQGIVQAVPEINPTTLDACVQAGILSAHGNSGAILAEMLTSVCRALQQAPEASRPTAAGTAVAGHLRGAALAATRAVARPVAGTVLSVADAAAAAAEHAAQESPDRPLAVAAAARAGAQEALLRTRDQLEVLGRAGVVDAGGQAYVLLLDVLVEVLGGPTAVTLVGVAPPLVEAGVPGQRGTVPSEYEVMYAIQGAPRTALDALRTELSVLGHSVVIVGDQSVAQVHVHLDVPGSAVEAGLALGRLSQVRIVALEPTRHQEQRTVLSLVVGEGLAAAVEQLGGVAVRAGRGQLTVDELSTALAHTCGDVVILPNDMENLEIASHLVDQLKSEGRHLAVIPTVAQVQGLAAIAVHEPTADFDSAVVAMSTAAAHIRQGAVTIAEGTAMTMAGRCRPGDVLGVVEGDFVEIGTSVADVAWRVIQRLLASGGELLTLVTGEHAAPGLVADLERRLGRVDPGVDVETVAGGQHRYPLLIGVE